MTGRVANVADAQPRGGSLASALPSGNHCVDPAANFRHVSERQVLRYEIEVWSSRAQEFEIGRLSEDACTELGSSRLCASGVNVLQVSEDEAILEPVEEHRRRLFVRRNERRRDVVVRVAHDLEVLRGEALEEPDHLVFAS